MNRSGIWPFEADVMQSKDLFRTSCFVQPDKCTIALNDTMLHSNSVLRQVSLLHLVSSAFHSNRTRSPTALKLKLVKMRTNIHQIDTCYQEPNICYMFRLVIKSPADRTRLYKHKIYIYGCSVTEIWGLGFVTVNEFDMKTFSKNASHLWWLITCVNDSCEPN